MQRFLPALFRPIQANLFRSLSTALPKPPVESYKEADNAIKSDVGNTIEKPAFSTKKTTSKTNAADKNVTRLLELFREGKALKDVSEQKGRVDEIVTLMGAVDVEKLLGTMSKQNRKVFCNSLMSVIGWRGCGRQFHAIFMQKWEIFSKVPEIFDGRCISNMLNAISKSRIDSKDSLALVGFLTKKITPELEMDGHSLSLSLVSLTKMIDSDRDAITDSIVCLSKKITPDLQMSGQSVSYVLYALSKMKSDLPAINTAIDCLAGKINSHSLDMSGRDVTFALRALTDCAERKQSQIDRAIAYLQGSKKSE